MGELVSASVAAVANKCVPGFFPPLLCEEAVVRSSHSHSCVLTCLLADAAGVCAWHFEQYLEEGVFIPGGCPHQVRNLMSCSKVCERVWWGRVCCVWWCRVCCVWWGRFCCNSVWQGQRQ